MSYTLRGRIESRLAALLPVVASACVLTAVLDRWWPVQVAALMAGVGLLLDVQVYDRLRYQPAWAALPIGAVELGIMIGVMRLLGIAAPLGEAIALFAGGWLSAQLLGHAGFPLLRLGYAEDGGELGRLGIVSVLAVAVALTSAGAVAYAGLRPVVHLAAGVHQGPLVITRREILVGEPGAIVRGGIVIRSNDVTVKNVTVVGGENGITVNSVRGTVLDGVSVSGAKLDGIHVRLAGIMIKNCTVDMHGNSLGQGIDIAYNMDLGMSMVEGCTVIGGMEGITTHSSMTDIVHDKVSGTELRGISVTEMSMGTVMDNEVSGALGIGIYCNDRSMCMIEHNTVLDTRADVASGNPTRRGFGVLASFQSQASLRGNQLSSNPVPMGAVINSEIAATH
ncbi:MAG TPA: right-handed parallel beta-helix repeat-containing protein [Gaiellaceae bacterium]|nr:right-handed parallel beta-helix repeat-containing protein [Gaiellaceae bacterium]